MSGDGKMSQPVPVEPFRRFRGVLKPVDRGMWVNGPCDYYHDAEVDTRIDSLQSALKLAQEERDAKDRLITNYEEWLSVSGENAKELQKRAEKAESLNRRMVELLKEPSEGIADSVRGVLQMLRNRSGVTYEQIKEHCSMRGDDLSWWPKWADDVLPAYVTEQGAALLLFKAMSAKLEES